MEQEILGCWRCNNELRDDEQQIQLLCRHSMHTACFLEIVHLNYACPHCNEPINPNDMDHEEHEEQEHQTEESRIQTLYANDNAFQVLVKKIAKKRSEISKKETVFLKCVKDKKAEIRNQLLVIRAQLEGLTETKKTEIRNSVPYKEYIGAKRNYSMLVGRLRANYNCSERKMARSLSNKVGFRRFTPLRLRSYYRSPFVREFSYHISI